MLGMGARRIFERERGRLSVRARAAGDTADSDAVSLRNGLNASLALPLGPHPPWTTWIGTEVTDSLVNMGARTLDVLTWLVEHAAKDGLGVRTPGAGHSTSAVARPDRFLLSTLESGAEPARWLKPGVDGARMRTVHAGTRVKTLNRLLLTDLALQNMGSFDGQTVAGALCTGTHGSSVHTGPMADSVRSVDLVVVEESRDGPSARAYRIEPDNGITDSDAFNRARGEHGMHLIQNDDVFHSVVVSFGSVGILHALTLELVDPYWLAEENTTLSWADLRLLLQPDHVSSFDVPMARLLAENDFVEFLVNSADAQHRPRDPLCLLRKRNRVPPIERPANWRKDWPPRRVAGGGGPIEALVRPRIDNSTGEIIGVVEVADTVRSFFQREAAEAPFQGGMDRSLSHFVLRRLRDDTPVAEPPEPPPETISNEIAVPMECTVEAVDLVLDVMRSNEYFYPIPFGVRFVGPSRHFLAPQWNRYTTMLEIPLVLPNRPGRREQDLPKFRDALGQIETALCYSPSNVRGRPHWGQYHIAGRDELERLGYERLDTFERVRARFNAAGIFDNRHTRQIGLRS